MANKHHIAMVSCWIFVLIASLDTISHTCVEGKQVSNEIDLRPKPKGTVKTIEVPEDGDVIDCVLFHKQPAFDHPLINNLQIPKVDIPKLPKDEEQPKIYQSWHKYGECPKGTIPIRRTRQSDIHQKNHFNNSGLVMEDATASQPVGIYQGTFAIINVWKPNTEANEYSSAQLWIYSTNNWENILEAGWIVYPARYHDAQPRLFIHWTNNDISKGCYDLDCSGFVQTNHEIALGSPLAPWSDYNKTITEAYFYIYKGKETGYWYFLFQGEVLGYWPSSIIPKLRDQAEIVTWGGEITNTKAKTHHTTTQMGSGHFSSEGNKRSAYIRNIQVMNNDYIFEPASNLQLDVWNKKCYDVTVGEKGTIYFSHIYFGGPGYSAQCP